MRLMSFSLTTPQIERRTKFVTRRLGWSWLTPGTQLWAVEKGMGLKKGEKVRRLAIIEVVDVREERLDRMIASPASYGEPECRSEGFPGLTPQQFVEMFCSHHRCLWSTVVTRIRFRYLDWQPDRVMLHRLENSSYAVAPAGVSSAAPADQDVPRRRRSPRVGKGQ